MYGDFVSMYELAMAQGFGLTITKDGRVVIVVNNSLLLAQIHAASE